MSKRILLLSLFCGLLGIAAGCQVACWPYCGMGGDPDLSWGPGSYTCDTGPSCGGCGECGGCGLFARCRARRACVEDCGDCGGCGECGGAAACEPACGDPCCPQRPIVGPLSWLGAIFTHDSYWGGSCSSYRYWGDFYGDPPDICDPCDECGNFTGRGYGGGCADGDCQGGGIVRRGGCPTCGNPQYARAVESPRPAQVATRRTAPQTTARKPSPPAVAPAPDPRRSAATARTRRTSKPQVAATPTMTEIGDRVVRPAVASESDPIIATKIISETDRVVSTSTENVAEGPKPRPATRR